VCTGAASRRPLALTVSIPTPRGAAMKSEETTMRVMLKSQLEVEAANLAISDGSIAKVFGTVFGACRPEATYFLTENGKRTVYAIFDMKSLDQIPALAEPLFQGLGATVDFMPVMNQAELEAGLKSWAISRG
jgi:hypothetical protein